MGTTAQKLTYLNDTKSQLKTMISYGYPLTNETFREYVGGVFKALINSMSNTTNPTWNNLPKITTTAGTTQSINNTIEAPMRIELGASELSQSGTPSPTTPQDIHTISGSNTIRVGNGQLFDKTKYTNEKYLKTDGTDVTNPSFCYSDYIEVNHNTTYYVSGLANGSGWNSAYCLYDKNKTFIAGYTTSNVTNFSIATTETTRYIRISVKLVDLDTTMVNIGNSALPYQPYVSQEADINLDTIEYCKISTYEDKFIRNSGKNLLDLENATYTKDGITAVVDNGKITLNGTATANSLIYIPVNLVVSAQKYSWSANNPVANSNVILRFDSNIMPDTLEVINKTKSYTFENETSLTYLCIRTTNATTLSNFIIYPQFEVGNASDYEPYGSNEWYIKKNIGKVVLDGSESYQTNPNGTNSYNYTIGDVYKKDGTLLNIMCNLFKGVAYDNRATSGDNICYLDGGATFVLTFRNTTYASVDDLKTMLSSNNAIIYYILKTPTYTKITGTLAEQLEYVYQLLKSYKGVTNISQINNDLSFNLNVQAIEELV